MNFNSMENGIKLWIWGCGKFGEMFLQYHHNEFQIMGFIDNDERKHGTCFDYKVINFNEYRLLYEKDMSNRIIICVANCDSIIEQIENAGLSEAVYGYSSGYQIDKSIMDYWNNGKIYSWLGEEVIVKYLLRERLGANYSGVYVDAGCYHPYRISNTAWAYETGWKGINIDANPRAIQLFDKYRPNDINVNCGISDEEGILKFNCYGEMSTMDSFVENHNLNKKARTIDIPVKKLDKILVENHIEKIDYLDLDVEGFDEKIIMSFDWNKYKPIVISVELVMGIEDMLQSNVYKKLCSIGYRLDSVIKITAIFVLK